jgi:hypothetical protein
VSETQTENYPTQTEPVAAPEAEAPETETGDELEGEEEEAVEPSEPEPEEELELSAPPAPVDDFEILAGQKSQTYWEKTVGPRIVAEWGDSAKYLLECPLCMTTHKGFVDARDQGQYPPPIVKAIQEFMGISQEQEYQQDPDTRTCPRCGGPGTTKTGSTNPKFATKPCGTCGGYGYVPPPESPQSGGHTAAPNGSGTTSHVAPPADDFQPKEVDRMGQPRILPDGRPNPNFMVYPEAWIAVEPYGSTVGLGAQDA